MIRKHVAVVGINLAVLQDLQGLSHERDAMRIMILRRFRRNRPPPGCEIDVLPSHPAHFTAALCREQHHEKRIVQRLRKPDERFSIVILRFGLMQGRPELPQLVSRQDAIAALLVGRLSDSQRRIRLNPVALDGEGKEA